MEFYEASFQVEAALGKFLLDKPCTLFHLSMKISSIRALLQQRVNILCSVVLLQYLNLLFYVERSY